MSSLIVIGLGAATLDLIRPWAEQGKLPGFQMLLEKGTCAAVKIPLPSASNVSWATFLTGCNPGGHGVYGHVQMDAAGSFVPADSRDIGTQTLWQILDQQGIPAAFLFLPITYPLPETRSRLIAGQGVPSSRSDFISPVGFKSELADLVNLARLVEPIPAGKTRSQYLDLLTRNLEAQLKVAREVIGQRRERLVIAAFTQLDRLQQYFWHELSSPGDPIFSFLQSLDSFLVELLAEHNDADLLVISDNGSGAIKKTLHMNVWLKQKGSINLKPANKINRAMIWQQIVRWFYHFLPASLRQHVGLSCRSRRAATELPYLSAIDRMESSAFSICERIYLSPYLSIEQRKAIRQILINELSSLNDPETGESLIGNIHTKEELFIGKNAANAPDLDFILADESIQVMPEALGEERVLINIGSPQQDQLFRSGNHRHQGFMIAKGPNIGCQESPGELNMADFLPTILELMGVKSPAGLSGVVCKI